MPVESFAEASGGAWWFQDSQLLIEKLQSAETLLALVSLSLIAILIVTIRVSQTRRSQFDDELVEVVKLTNQGPIVAGAHARVYLLGVEPAVPIAALIEEVDRRFISVSVPMSEAGRLRAGASVEVMTPAGAAAYRFTGIVQDRRKREHGLLLIFDRPAWVERVQRRSHFRVPVNMPTTVARIDEEAPTKAAFRAMLHDLSAGGVTVSVPFKAPSGALLRVRIPLQGVHDCSYEVRVLRSLPGRPTQPGMHALGCEFLSMDEAVKEQLTRVCFEQEKAANARVK